MMQSMLLYVDRGQDPCLTKPDPPPPPQKRKKMLGSFCSPSVILKVASKWFYLLGIVQ